jgi:polyisoprenoid-binding protein YceI
MHQALRIAVLSLFVVPAFAPAAEYEVDPEHSNASFTTKHMMVSNVRGEFSKISGKVVLDEKNLAKSSIEASIDATSVTTRVAARDGHLKSEDFFWVEKHPNITFKSTKVAAGKGKDQYVVTGDLTIRGVTKPVTLDVNSPAAEVKDLGGGLRRGATATAKVNRKDWNLNWNKALEAGGVLVGDEVTLNLDIELKRKPDAPSTDAAPK